jgi:hypothetical protein
LRSLKPPGVIQELYALLIVHYAVSLIMHEAAYLAAVDPDQLSFTHALQGIQEAISEFQMTALELLPNVYQRMLRDIATERLPARRLRTNARVVKRKMSKFHFKRPKHHHWPQTTRSFGKSLAAS